MKLHPISILCVTIVTLAGGALAYEAPPGGPKPSKYLFQLEGTPEEQAACAPDSSRFCAEDIPDNLRVLACLQEHREKLRKVCRKVLEDHGR